MRFDDRIATIMGLPAAHPAARAAKWRQLVDLLAQRRGEEISPEVEHALEWLRSNRADIDAATRQEAARSLSGRTISPLLFGFFAEDTPSVAAPLVAGARLTPSEWLSILPTMTQTSRALLRNRRDLDVEVERALFSFGRSDLGIPGRVDPPAPMRRPVQTAAAGEGGEPQTGDLVEAFRKTKSAEIGGTALAQEPWPPIEAFRWETASSGVIVWVEGAPRGPLVGQSIASIAGREQFGVDGQAAGAFEKRAPFRDARFNVAGSGLASGDWRISGVPFFDPYSGAFLGYRGSARRPRLDEVAATASGSGASGGLFGTNIPADALRQLIHELRTPLNAIVGFGEMIDGQYMGPAAPGYRSRAAEIVEQAGRLLSAVDDLDTAARIETSRLEMDDGAVDAAALLSRLHEAYERLAVQRGARIQIDISDALPPTRAELGAAERMFARMLAGTIGLAHEGETIAATMRMDQLGAKKMLRLAIDRPQAIEGLDEAALLDPGYSPEGDWPGAPALGLGFALRLVRNLAEAVGGALHIGRDRFSLYLPALEAPGLSSGQGS